MARRQSATQPIVDVDNTPSTPRPPLPGFNLTYQTKHAQNVGHKKCFTPSEKRPRVSQERRSIMPQQVPRRCGLEKMFQLVLRKPRERLGRIFFGSLTDGKTLGWRHDTTTRLGGGGRGQMHRARDCRTGSQLMSEQPLTTRRELSVSLDCLGRVVFIPVGAWKNKGEEVCVKEMSPQRKTCTHQAAGEGKEISGPTFVKKTFRNFTVRCSILAVATDFVHSRMASFSTPVRPFCRTSACSAAIWVGTGSGGV